MPRKSAAKKAAAQGASLFDDDDAAAAAPAGAPALTVNRRYERAFNERKERQEMGRIAALGGPAGGGGAGAGAGADEESLSSDDEGEALTAAVEGQISATIRAIRARDPRIYDASAKFFAGAESGAGAEGGAGAEAEAEAEAAPKKAAKKGARAKDVLRQQLVEAAERGDGDAFADDDDDAGAGGRRAVDDGDRSANVRVYNDEQAALRRAFLATAAEAEAEAAGVGAGAGDEGLLRRKRRTPAEEQAEAAAIAADREALRLKMAAKGGGVAKHADEIKDPDAFLNAMMTSKAWRAIERDHDGDDDEDEDEAGAGGGEAPADSEDDEELAKADEFEAQYNFRFEQPGGAQIVTHARGSAAADSMRRVETKRKDERDRKKARKEAERAEAEADTRRLMNLKRKQLRGRLHKIREVAGGTMDKERLAAVLGDSLEGDFDPAEHDRQMSLLFGDDFYAEPEAEPGVEFEPEPEEEEGAAGGEERRAPRRKVAPWVFGDGPRPEWAGPSAEELARGADDLGIDAALEGGEEGEGGGGGGGGGGEGGEEGEGGGEDDYDPAIHGASRRRKREGKRAREGKKRMTAIQRVKAQLAAEARAERGGAGSAAREADPDEVLALGFEDVIAGGLRTRFKYVPVPPQDFGLSSEEILLLDDADLNGYVGLRRIAPYRDQEWVVPSRKRQRTLQALRDKLRDEVERLGLAKPNVVGGSQRPAGREGVTNGEGAEEEDEAGDDGGAGGTADGEETEEERKRRKRRLRKQRREAEAREEAAAAAKGGKGKVAKPAAGEAPEVVTLASGATVKKSRLASYNI